MTTFYKKKFRPPGRRKDKKTKSGQHFARVTARRSRSRRSAKVSLGNEPYSGDGPNTGKFNYINRNGEVMSENWFDSASDFKDDVAKVSISGVDVVLDKQGYCLMLTQEKNSVGLKS